MTNWVFDHLIWSEAGERANDLAMAAMAGDDELAAMLTGGDNSEVRPHHVDTAPVIAGAFLQSLTVQGFRGIGP